MSDQSRDRVRQVDRALRRLRRSPAGEALWLLVLGCCGAIHIAALVAAFSRPDAIDFAAFVDNARAWLDGTPYPDTNTDPNVPHIILLFAPFAGLSRGVGLVIWMALSYAALAIALRLVRRELALHPSRPVLVTALALIAAALPMVDVIVNGNMIWLLLLPFTIAWIAARRGRLILSGAVIGVLMTAKPFLAVFLVLFAMRQQWRGAAGAVTAAVLTLALSLLLTGVDAWAAWMEAVDRISWYDVRFNASFFGMFARVWRPEAVAWAAGAAVLGTATAIRIWRTPADADRDWLVVLLGSLLMAPLGWRYYLCFALGPLLALSSRGALTRGGAIAALGLAWCPAIAWTTRNPAIQITLGSLPFWFVLGGWVVLNRLAAHTASASPVQCPRAVTAPGSTSNAGVGDRRGEDGEKTGLG